VERGTASKEHLQNLTEQSAVSNRIHRQNLITCFHVLFTTQVGRTLVLSPLQMLFAVRGEVHVKKLVYVKRMVFQEQCIAARLYEHAGKECKSR